AGAAGESAAKAPPALAISRTPALTNRCIVTSSCGLRAGTVARRGSLQDIPTTGHARTGVEIYSPVASRVGPVIESSSGGPQGNQTPLTAGQATISTMREVPMRLAGSTGAGVRQRNGSKPGLQQALSHGGRQAQADFAVDLAAGGARELARHLAADDIATVTDTGSEMRLHPFGTDT